MGKHGSELNPCPPTVIRGQDSQKGATGVGLHWCRGSFPVSVWPKVFSYLTGLFGEPEHSDFGLWHYDAVMTWPNGMLVRYHTREDRYALTAGRFALECPGEAVAAMEPLALIDFLQTWDRDLQLVVSRLDERMLDYEWIISPIQLAGLGIRTFDPETKEVTNRDFTGLESYDESFPCDGKKLRMAELCFGRRGSLGSGSYLRFYDKELESGGDVMAACWELESSGDKARRRFRDILDAVKWAKIEGQNDPQQLIDAMTSTIGRHIGGCIDFIHRDQGDKNLSRCPRYDFWEKILVKLSGRLTWVSEKTKRTVEKAKAYVFHQVVPTLQMLKAALSPERFWDWLRDECIEGEDRLRAVHRKVISDYRVAMAVGEVLPVDIEPLLRAFGNRYGPPPCDVL